MRLRPCPLKRPQAVLGTEVKTLPLLGSPFVESLDWTWVGKLRSSPLVRTGSDLTVGSSPTANGFSEGGSAAMGGRNGERCFNNVYQDAVHFQCFDVRCDLQVRTELETAPVLA
jgi:hypothetical protein